MLGKQYILIKAVFFFPETKMPFVNYPTLIFLSYFSNICMFYKIQLMRLWFPSSAQHVMLYYAMILNLNLATICCLNNNKNALGKWTKMELLPQMLISSAFCFVFLISNCLHSSLIKFINEQLITSVHFKCSNPSTKKHITA